MAKKERTKRSPIRRIFMVLLGLVIAATLAFSGIILYAVRGESSSEASSLLTKEQYRNADANAERLGKPVNDASFDETASEVAEEVEEEMTEEGGTVVSGSAELSDTFEFTPAGGSGATDQASSEYIIPDSDSRLITPDEAKALSNDNLRLAINEIYARHGRLFDDANLQAYFNEKSWYKGTIAPSAFSESVLNGTEKANLDLLTAERSSR